MKESRLKWCGHVKRREEGMWVKSDGDRCAGGEKERRRGRPKRTWMNGMKHGVTEEGLPGEEAQEPA